MQPLDIQVNGFGGVDFNSDGLTAEQLHASAASLQRHGAGQILATIITAGLEQMRSRIAALVLLRAADPLACAVIAGIHIEGPFISPEPGYVGAHPPEHVRPASVDAMQPLIEAGDGLVRLVTLAPEHDAGLRVTRHLADRGIRVAAGHTAAQRDVLLAAADAGLSIFTHVGNGCPVTLPRHDNIINRALSLADRLWLCFIPDGVHIPFFALAGYLRSAGWRRSIAVTDAISAAGMGPGTYPLGNRQVEVGGDLIARSPGGPYLAGSTLTPDRMLGNLNRELGLDAAQAQALVAENPRAALGM
jgi:N-acetylglucosamine-6-phosphate deacetylase